jgi:hypothetical protein
LAKFRGFLISRYNCDKFIVKWTFHRREGVSWVCEGVCLFLISEWISSRLSYYLNSKL